MIINGLGFTNRRLYLTPQFFASKPTQEMLGDCVSPEQLNDHALGKALDEIAEYGETKLFGEIAFDIAREHGLLGRRAHLDTTSFSLHGRYESEKENEEVDHNECGAAPEDDDESQVIQITHGYSKDRRPDLKQVMLSLTTTGAANVPIWMEPQDGNSSDKKTFQETAARVRAFQQQIHDAPDFVWVADSAMYVPEKLLTQGTMRWITRVPETISACRELVSVADETIAWIETAGGYKVADLCSSHGGIRQRWILVSSSKAYEREKKTFEKRLDKQNEELRKECRHIEGKLFACDPDARAAVQDLQRRYKYHTITLSIDAEKKHQGRGRPAKNAEPKIVGYRATCQITQNETAILFNLRRKGRFVLATNELDPQAMDPLDVLQEYKEQQGVERGFRFIKDPWFMVDSFFLKSARRISALMMVMTLCLLVYNFAQHRLRSALRENRETIPNQLGKKIQTPTIRWVFQLMEGISIVSIYDASKRLLQRVTTNIDNVRHMIIRLFGPTALKIYGIQKMVAEM